MPKPSSDSDDEDDTAFGGLAPRSGPLPEPATRKPGRWGWVIGLVLGLVLLALLLWLMRG